MKENIKNFRGDPNWITLVGHSTGAASVGLHLLSPRSHSKCYSLVYTNLFSFDCKTSYSVYVDHTLSSSSNQPVLSYVGKAFLLKETTVAFDMVYAHS